MNIFPLSLKPLLFSPQTSSFLSENKREWSQALNQEQIISASLKDTTKKYWDIKLETFVCLLKDQKRRPSREPKEGAGDIWLSVTQLFFDVPHRPFSQWGHHPLILPPLPPKTKNHGALSLSLSTHYYLRPKKTSRIQKRVGWGFLVLFLFFYENERGVTWGEGRERILSCLHTQRQTISGPEDHDWSQN